MEIKYLKELQQNNPVSYRDGISFSLKGISGEEVNVLEQLYNEGKPFPKALKELLLLAGNSCYVLDYGLNESQQDLQEYVRNEMQEEGRVITRPFYAIDVYNAGDQFLFVYLDEGDDPAVHEGHYYDSITRTDWITDVSPTLSGYIYALVQRVKQGQNPF